MADSLTNLRNPVVVMAFEGWNDAAAAASATVDHLAMMYDATVIYELDGDSYYDFQVNRPRIEETDEGRQIIWPTVSLSVAELPERDLVLVSGPEPNMRWRQFCTDLVSALRSVKPSMVVLLGAMLGDVPHTRPVPVQGTTEVDEITARLGLQTSDYEGPTGITGVLADACRRAGMPVVTLWASVPHYVADPPNPKSTLALLARVEDLLEARLDLGDLPEVAQAWQRGVDQAAADDPDAIEYIGRLEQAHDTEDLPEVSGDVIAAELQRFLRRRADGQGPI